MDGEELSVAIKNLQKIRYIASSMIEGGFYGFLLAFFLWGFLYIVYLLEGYGNTNTELNVHRVPYSVDLFKLSIILISVGSLVRSLQRIYNKFINDSLMNWLKTGIITFVFLYIIVLIEELYLVWIFDNDCCYEFTNFPLWILIFVLISIFSVLYAVVKKIVANLFN